MQHKQHQEDTIRQQREHVRAPPAEQASMHDAAMPTDVNAVESGATAQHKPFDRQEYVLRFLTGGGGNDKDLPGVARPDEMDEEFEPLMVEGSSEVSIEAARAKEEEVWVLKVPCTVKLELLDGCTLHLPCELPEARHLNPPKDLLSGRYDLLAYVKAAVKPTHIGHLELAPGPAYAACLNPYRELLQEGEYVAAKLRCAAPTHDGVHEKLQTVKVARVIHVSDDVLTLNRQALALAMVHGRPLWGDAEGWDGQLPPRKRRKRVAGWDVIGIQPDNGDASSEEFDDPFGGVYSSSGSEEEFDEVVFLPEKEQPILKEEQERQQQEAEGKDEVEAAAEVQQQLMQSLTEDVQDPVDWDERWYEGDHWDPLAHYYQQQQQQQQQPGPSTQPDMDEEDLDPDLYEYFTSIPVRPEVAAEQQAYAENPEQYIWEQRCRALSLQQAQEQQGHHVEDQQVEWQQQGWQDGEGQPADWQPAEGQHEDFQTPSRQQQYDTADSDVVVIDDYSPSTPPSARKIDDAGLHEFEAGRVGDSPLDVNPDHWDQEEEAAGVMMDADMSHMQPDDAAQGNENTQEEACYKPPRTIAEMLAPILDQEQEELISQMPTYAWQLRLRNLMVLELLSYEELCQQVDVEAMRDDDVFILLHFLLKYRNQLYGIENPPDPQREQLAQLLLPSEGPSPRPCFKQVDQGYAPYQVDDEGREVVVIPPPSPDWQTTDQHLAERVVKHGAGRLHRFVTTEELRSKGFDWDSDPEEERREGLSITLPDGTSMHIPSGLHLPIG